MKRITSEKARELALKINADSLMDGIYGEISELFMHNVVRIESRYEIISEDGTPYTEDDDEQWYDEIREDFFEKCYDVIHASISDR